MPSFDIVSEVDLQEVRNAVENATCEAESRFDFRNVEASFELNEKNETIKVPKANLISRLTSCWIFWRGEVAKNAALKAVLSKCRTSSYTAGNPAESMRS